MSNPERSEPWADEARRLRADLVSARAEVERLRTVVEEIPWIANEAFKQGLFGDVRGERAAVRKREMIANAMAALATAGDGGKTGEELGRLRALADTVRRFLPLWRYETADEGERFREMVAALEAVDEAARAAEEKGDGH